jgi:hypothetical protein
MSKIIIEFETDNAAFEDDSLCPEIARILGELARKIESYDRPDDMKVYDVNGNKVGTVTYLED